MKSSTSSVFSSLKDIKCFIMRSLREEIQANHSFDDKLWSFTPISDWKSELKKIILNSFGIASDINNIIQSSASSQCN